METTSPSREKCNTREALLSAAEALFTQKGYAAVGTREIAEAAGANLGAIQYHFGTKAQLFVEVIRNIMRRRNESGAARMLTREVENREEAAEQLCAFISALLGEIFSREGSEMCRLLFREILGETSFDPAMREALVSAAVEEFMRPAGELLQSLLKKISGAMSDEEIGFTANSVVGQCVFYITHQPFLERLQGQSCCDERVRTEAARHISRFTLRALGCPGEVIRDAERAVFDGKI